jgi:signal transduction histidine kinase
MPPRAPPRPLVLLAIALAGCAAAACTVVLALSNDHLAQPGVRSALLVWTVLSYILAGLVAWWRRPNCRLGLLMVAVGFTSFLTGLQWANLALPYTLGAASDLLPPVLFLHVFLAFPTGRLDGWFERALIVAGYVIAVGLQLGVMTLGGFGTGNLLELASKPDAASLVQGVQLVVLSAFSLAGIGVLVVRRRSAGRPLRRWVALLIDSFALGLLMVAFLLLSDVFGAPGGDAALEWIRRAAFVVIGLAPLAFLVGLLQARLARSAIGELVIELRGDPAPGDLRDALARALRDRSLELAYWRPDAQTYVDLDGRRMELANQDGRAVTRIERDGAPVAALIHDRALNEERELLDAVGAAAGIALQNARLQAELRARLEELRGSRARIVEAAHTERQRLERDLHDGAQQRLVATSLELSLLEDLLDQHSAARRRLAQARRELAKSLEELREIARGIHPAVVSAHGLAVALEQLAALAPVPISLRVELTGRLPESLEVAAYYVVSESLANIAKHARATTASIAVVRINDRVLVEVVDDGVGGADTERGSGLRGLTDRVEALNGQLCIWSPFGGGTRVKAELPCA